MIDRDLLRGILERQEKLVGQLQEATTAALTDDRKPEEANELAAATTVAIDGFRSLSEVQAV